MFAEQLVQMGLDEIQHENMLILNFLKDVQDTRTPARFTAVADRAAGLDLNSKEVQDFITLLKEKNIVIDPTINVFENMFTARPGQIPDGYDSIAPTLPSQVRRGLLGGGLPVPEGKDQRYRDSWKTMLHFLKALFDAGISIVPGTDSLPGFSLHRELELYAQAGIPAPEILRIATILSAKVLKQDSDLGSIHPGKLADLVLIEGDPANNISNIRNVRMVIKDGILLDPKDLYSAVGVSHHSDQP
jgi:imidazolonepropionase-like amidohydrolase